MQNNCLHYLSTNDRGRALGQLEACQSITTAATVMGVSKCVISWLKKVAERGNAVQKHAGCHVNYSSRGSKCIPRGEKQLKSHS